MNQDAVIAALVEVARRRHLLERDPSRRLARYARERGVHTLLDLHQWLGAADGINPELAKRLENLLAPVDMAPFGPYWPLAHLADGGMGRVWLAASDTGPLVVVKTVKRPTGSESSRTERLQRFERESRITRQLAHPNVVRCLDSGHQPDGTEYLVLEYIDSGDLRDLVTLRRHLPEPLSLAIIHQVVDALGEADRLHIVHRDLKPSNIFVARDGKALLADFGIARSTAMDRTELTMAGAMIGSPQYMSPEQIDSKQTIDIRSDLYSLGAVLYYCLTGQPPFDGKVQDILHLHCHVPPPDVRALAPAVSQRTAALISHLLDKRPEGRPADPTVVRTLIEQALAGLGVTVSQAMVDETDRDALSRGLAPMTHASIPIGGDHGEATIIADLSGRDTGPLIIDIATDPNSPVLTTQTGSPVATAIRTLTANLLASEVTPDGSAKEPQGKQRGDSGTGVGTDSDQKQVSSGPVLEPISGDVATAIAKDWISLLSTTPGDPSLVMLFARPTLILGKLKDPPVDICLRNYPVPQYKDVLQRISRQHVQLRYDRLLQQCIAEDLGGSNGTLLDGTPLVKGQPRELSGKNAHVLIAASAVSLWIRPRKARRTYPIQLQDIPPESDAACGLETDHLHDAVLLTRPENRPELVYAMVLRRVSIGGPGSDIALVGARSLVSVVIARYAGKWFWKTAVEDGWKPLCSGQELDCGGKIFRAHAGDYQQF